MSVHIVQSRLLYTLQSVTWIFLLSEWSNGCCLCHLPITCNSATHPYQFCVCPNLQYGWYTAGSWSTWARGGGTEAMDGWCGDGFVIRVSCVFIPVTQIVSSDSFSMGDGVRGEFEQWKCWCWNFLIRIIEICDTEILFLLWLRVFLLINHASKWDKRYDLKCAYTRMVHFVYVFYDHLVSKAEGAAKQFAPERQSSKCLKKKVSFSAVRCSIKNFIKFNWSKIFEIFAS